MRAYRIDVHYSRGDWDVLSFYCHWQLSMKPEKVVAKGFYKMLQDWQPDYMEAMKYISDNYLNLSNELRHDILENGKYVVYQSRYKYRSFSLPLFKVEFER